MSFHMNSVRDVFTFIYFFRGPSTVIVKYYDVISSGYLHLTLNAVSLTTHCESFLTRTTKTFFRGIHFSSIHWYVYYRV